MTDPDVAQNNYEEIMEAKLDKGISQQVIRTDLFTKFGQFFVSTCYRRSSAALNPDGWYYETFGWKVEDKKRTDWIADNSGASFLEGGIDQHNEVCKQLLLNGEWRDSDD